MIELKEIANFNWKFKTNKKLKLVKQTTKIKIQKTKLDLKRTDSCRVVFGFGLNSLKMIKRIAALFCSN